MGLVARRDPVPLPAEGPAAPSKLPPQFARTDPEQVDVDQFDLVEVDLLIPRLQRSLHRAFPFAVLRNDTDNAASDECCVMTLLSYAAT